MEMIAMLNGLPTTLANVVAKGDPMLQTSTAYNRRLAGVPPVSNPTLPQRGGWQRGGLQQGLSFTAAASLGGAPTTAASVADMVRSKTIASQQFNNYLAGIPESPAEAARAARAGIIASQQYNRNLVPLMGLGQMVDANAPGAKKSLMDKFNALPMWQKAALGVAVVGVGYFGYRKLMK
jgi:hypothetical protein